MSSPSFDAVLGGFGAKAIDALKIAMADSWDSLTDDEKAQCERLLFALAKAHLLEVAGQDVSDYLPALEAAFLQWRTVGKIVVASAMKQAATEVFGLAGAFAAGAVGQLIKGAV